MRPHRSGSKRTLSRRAFLASSAAAIAPAALGASASSAHAAGHRPPNIVIVFADDLGYGDVGCYGATGYATPRLDRMAAEGMKFDSFYVAAPVCTPSRAALMTGCYPKRLGLAHRVLFPFSRTGLHPSEVTLAELLKGQGYATACIGKWHLGHHRAFLPTRQGFDLFFGTPYSNDMGNHTYAAHNFTAPPLPLFRQERVIENDPDQRYLTRRYTGEAVRFIEENRERPFFLYLPHNMPHDPIAASERFAGTTQHGLYGDVITEIDWSVGEVLAAIEAQGLDRDTLVLFTSDNGPRLFDPARTGYQPGSPGPLAGQKGTTWEGGMREPCLMRWPGAIPRGAVCNELATAMDLFPTIANLTAAPMPADRIIDGKDIWPLISGQPGATTPHEVFYYYRDDRLEALRSGPWKLHLHKPEWKEGENAGGLLFNLDQDIGERNDCAAQHTEIVQRLQTLAAAAREDLGDALTGQPGANVRPVGTV